MRADLGNPKTDHCLEKEFKRSILRDIHDLIQETYVRQGMTDNERVWSVVEEVLEGLDKEIESLK